MKALRNQPVQDTYAGFRFMSQKEILDGKVRCLILRITRWKCNLFSLSSCHEFCKRFTTTPYTFVSIYAHECSHKCVWWNAGVLDLYTCSCAHEFAHIYSVFRTAFGSELFESFIRRDSLLTRPGKPDATRSAMECWSSYYRRVFDASFDAVDQENGKRIQSLARGYWEKIWILNCGITALILRKFVAISDSKCVKWSCYWMW